MRRTMLGMALALLALAVPLNLSAEEPRADAKIPDGTYRSPTGKVFSGNVVRVQGNKLTWSLPRNTDEPEGHYWKIQAEFTYATDGALYAIVTESGIHGKGVKPEDWPQEDDTFCLRFKTDGDKLTIESICGKGTKMITIPGLYYTRQ